MSHCAELLKSSLYRMRRSLRCRRSLFVPDCKFSTLKLVLSWAKMSCSISLAWRIWYEIFFIVEIPLCCFLFLSDCLPSLASTSATQSYASLPWKMQNFAGWWLHLPGIWRAILTLMMIWKCLRVSHSKFFAAMWAFLKFPYFSSFSSLDFLPFNKLPLPHLRQLFWHIRFTSIQIRTTDMSGVLQLLVNTFEARRPLYRSLQRLCISMSIQDGSQYESLWLKFCELPGLTDMTVYCKFSSQEARKALQGKCQQLNRGVELR